MPSKQPPIILEDDVFALTAKARQELAGAGTSLPQHHLETLVLIDGRSTVAATLARAEGLGIGRDNALATFGRLIDEKLIEPVKIPGAATDFVDFFGGKADARQAAETAALLKQRGYYVGIARRPGVKRRAADGAAACILIVEDEAVLAQLVRHVLESEGLQVKVAANRREIVDQMRRAPLPDLVLLDAMLPDADGFEVLERIRQHPKLKTLPVVMLTSMATREAVLKGLRGGADGYITKPFEIPVLIKAVHAVLGMSEELDVLATGDPWPA